MAIIEEDEAKLAEIGIVEELPKDHPLGHGPDASPLLDVLALLADAKSNHLWRLLLLPSIRLRLGSFDRFLARH